MSSPNDDRETVADIPVARRQPTVPMQLGKFSGMWWITLLCLFIAMGLVWWSLPESGVDITIRFPEGHGLQPEDPVLYRGIDVGVVNDVRLNEEQNGIIADVRLKSSAANLAREGTAFWIVRPRLSITEITGLETAVGHKYISLAPGPEGAARQINFDGWIDAPARDANSPGMEIVIRGERSHGVNSGSRVTFRGVQVGRVLSVGLSPDSRHVDIRAKILERHQQYLTTSSRFWVKSGIGFDFSLGQGVNFEMESLESILQGGVAFLTIDNDGLPVATGHVFRLHAEPEESWFAAANLVAATDIELRGVSSLLKTWTQPGMFGRRNRTMPFNGVPVVDADGNRIIIVPVDAISFPEKAVSGSTALTMSTGSGDLDIIRNVQQLKPLKEQPALGVFQVPPTTELNWLVEDRDFRIAQSPEDLLAVRATMEDGRWTHTHLLIEKDYLDENWALSRFDADRELWHGSPVLSADDGKVLGVLLISDGKARIARYAKPFQY
jgi:hypothetical protein